MCSSQQEISLKSIEALRVIMVVDILLTTYTLRPTSISSKIILQEIINSKSLFKTKMCENKKPLLQYTIDDPNTDLT